MIETSVPAGSGGPPAVGRPVETTGRTIVVFADDAEEAPVAWEAAGIADVADSRELAEDDVAATVAGAGATYFAELGIAVVTAEPRQLGVLQTAGAASGRRVLSVSPELVHHVLAPDAGEYAQAYRDGVADLTARLTGAGQDRAPGAGLPAAPAFADDARATWGIHATRAVASCHSGRGISVAVLDTGFDVGHPDFTGREVLTQSFVPGEAVQDGHGHGTHCIGTACGPREPDTGPRYGVAHEARILAGKVLSDAGSGSDAGILAGINWAVANRCHVVSMSLGADVQQSHPPYSAAGRRALRRGSLVIAAAGNNADRRAGDPGFVGAPANSVEIMAVGALDQQLVTTYFSARSGASGRGGQVDIAGPGWQVLSSWPMPERYRVISGTSMATPHVAGVAALWAEQTGRRGLDLWATLCAEAQRLMEPSVDVGSGLVVAPG